MTREQTEGSRENDKSDCPPSETRGSEFERKKTDLPGKTDSGPEPDVFGREIPPQDTGN